MAKSEYKKVMEAKQQAKSALFKRAYSGVSTDAPLLILFAAQGKNSSKERELLFNLMEGLSVLPCQVIVVDDDEPSDDTKWPAGKFSWVNSRGALAEKKIDEYLDAADMAFLFDQDHELVNRIMDKGIVIIAQEGSPYLQNYHPNEETGNSFTFSSFNPWEMFRALVRAHEAYRFPFDWGNIVRGILKK